MRRFPILLGAWAALLAAGFAAVLVLGAPARSPDEELAAALHPAPPVAQQAAEDAAAIIVRLQYPSFTGVRPTVARAVDFGVEHWVIQYVDPSGTTLRGMRISVVIATGRVEVSSFP